MKRTQIGHAKSPASWEAIYRRHLQKLVVRRLRIAALLVTVVVLTNAVAQFFFDSELFGQLLWARMAAIVICLGVWRYAAEPSTSRYTFLLSLLIIGIVSADLEAAIVLTSGYNSPFQTGLALLIVGAGLLVPFRPMQIGIICLMVWGVFLEPLLSGGEHISSHEPGFTSSTLFMVCATLITIASSIMTNRLRRDEFFARMHLREEQRRAERLLLNILPAPIAERLKQGEQSISDSFNDITVLFADIVGFTPMADSMLPDELVDMLNDLFSDFDRLVEQRGLEKIKTIGDAYMVVGGAPQPMHDHAMRAAGLALDMLQATEAYNRATGRKLALRIGMHSGPAVAGVIGLNKFGYDLWGDTVNTASRMQSHSEPGRIHISEQCRTQLVDEFICEERGLVNIKGKGEMTTFFLNGRRAAPATE